MMKILMTLVDLTFLFQLYESEVVRPYMDPSLLNSTTFDKRAGNKTSVLVFVTWFRGSAFNLIVFLSHNHCWELMAFCHLQGNLILKNSCLRSLFVFG